ncbi:protease inhibitor I42 family protein [Luteipulveratus mongoliensis]|nr:protease inhibitor I42 family protein [Luteipulveratus mongoliensis]
MESPRPGQQIDLSVEDSLEIRLSHPSGTGYRWSADRVPSCVVLRRADAELGPTKSPVRTPGQARTSVIELMATEPGDGELRLALGRPWESEPAEVVDLMLTVR